MSVTSWTDSANLGEWHTLVLDDNVFPGICRVEVNLPVEIDIQKGKGTRKARLKDEGDEPAKITIKLKMGQKGKEQAEIDALSKLLYLVRPKSKNGKREARKIQHPNPNFWGINKIVMAGIRSPMPDPVEGWEFEFAAIEWVPEPKKIKKPTAAADSETEDEKPWLAYKRQPNMSMDNQTPAGLTYTPSGGMTFAAPSKNGSGITNLFGSSALGPSTRAKGGK